MFKDSLIESHTQLPSPFRSWTTAASVVMQAAVASLILLTPLMHPDRLPLRLKEIPLALPVPSLLPPPPPPMVPRASVGGGGVAASAMQVLTLPRHLPSRIDAAPALDTTPINFSGLATNAPPGFLTDQPAALVVPAAAPSVQEKKKALVRVSAGVSAGLLLSPIRPTYPPIAKAAHIEGTIVIEAVISKTGFLESAHIVSGPAMLQSAALDAIRTARYQPFRLNGEATEVQTTITVRFRLAS